MKKYWFASCKKWHGYRPVTIEGWAVTVSLAVLILWAAYANGFFTGRVTVANVLHFLFEFLCFCIAFGVLFRSKIDSSRVW